MKIGLCDAAFKSTRHGGAKDCQIISRFKQKLPIFGQF
jgi:hypothetical protein